MYTYPKEFIICPPFLPTDEEYGGLPGAFTPLCLGAARTLKFVEVATRGQPDPCVSGSLGAQLALGWRLVGDRCPPWEEREGIFWRKFLVLKIGLCAIDCACAVMNSLG